MDSDSATFSQGTSGDSAEGDGSEGKIPRDILFFMRDKRSRTEIREVRGGSFWWEGGGGHYGTQV